MPTPTFDRAAIEHLARLAAVSLSDTEADAFARDLASIVAYVEELSSVDTSEVDSLGTTPGASPWREDEVRGSLAREDALAAAPRASEGGFAVPGFVPTSTSGGGRGDGR